MINITDIIGDTYKTLTKLPVLEKVSSKIVLTPTKVSSLPNRRICKKHSNNRECIITLQLILMRILIVVYTKT